VCSFIKVGHFTMDNASNNKTMMQVLLQSDHRVVVKVGRASSRSFKWVFIVYPDVMCFGDLGDLGGQQTVEMLACTYCSMKTLAGFTKQLREELLEVVIHTHTEERDQESVFHRRTSLKPIQRETTGIYT